MHISLVNCEKILLNEIADLKMRRRNIAKTYRLAMDSDDRNRIDWKRINFAIIERWSVSGLKWIKDQAWSGKCFH